LGKSWDSKCQRC